MLQCPTVLLCAVTCLARNCFKVLSLLLLYITLPAVSVGLVFMILKCQDYICYVCIKNVPVIITTAPVYLITLLLMILYLRRVRNTRAGKWYLDKTLAVTQLVFGTFFEEKRNPHNVQEEEEEKVFTVFGHEASLREMRWLFIILVQATLLAFAQFWDEFLLEESYLCSTQPKVDCFSVISLLPPQGQQTNCTDTSDTEIICYKYVFNTGHATASAIGIMSATSFIIYIVCMMFLKLLDRGRLHKWLITCMKILAIAEIFMFCQVLWFLPMIYITRSGFSAVARLEYYATLRSGYKTLTMSIMIISSIISFPWNKFRKTGYERLPE